MTDCMLLRECLLDHDMKQCSVILLDEAHERTARDFCARSSTNCAIPKLWRVARDPCVPIYIGNEFEYTASQDL